MKILKIEQHGDHGKPERSTFSNGIFDSWAKGYNLSEAPEESSPELQALKQELIEWGERMANESGYDSPKFKDEYDIIYRILENHPEGSKQDVEETQATLGYKLCLKVKQPIAQQPDFN